MRCKPLWQRSATEGDMDNTENRHAHMKNCRSLTGAASADYVASPRDGRGFTLVELMVALTIGLFMLAGLVTVFANSSRSHAEFANSTEQTENGAFAVRFVSEDLIH